MNLKLSTFNIILKSKFFFDFCLALLFSLLIFYLFIKKFVYPTIIPMEANGKLFFFADWLAIVSANYCERQGIDVYLQNPCDPWGRPHVYGPILLSLPFIENLSKIYYFYLPLLFNFFFIFALIRFFDFNKKIKNFYLLFLLFSIQTLLAIERANIDVLIFLFVVILAFYKNLISNILIIIIGTLSKFYPICLTIIFLFENKFSKIVSKLFITSFIIFFILFFYKDNLIEIYNYRALFSSYSVYGFGFVAALKNLTQVDNLIYLLLLCLPIFFIFRKYYNEIIDSSISKEFFSRDVFENRLYLLFSAVILSCYFIFSGFIYREIFFLGLIPFIVKKYEATSSKNFFRFYFYFLIFKFFISSILVYLNQNYILVTFQKQITFSKHLIDFYLILFVLIVFFNILFYRLRFYFVK